MNRTSLIARRLGATLIAACLSLALAPAHAAASHHNHGLSRAPAGLVAAIAKTQAKEGATNPAYRIASNGCAALKAGSKRASLKGCFANTGERFVSGEHTVALHLAAWGRTGHLQPVALQRTAPKANRIAYHGKDVSEWWRVLPMGYEQGFTVDRAPKGHGEIVLQLKTNRAPKVAHGILAWGGLHYGKLRVTEAGGKLLPSHLSAHGKTITIAFDARHARYPVRIDPMVWLEQGLTDPGNRAGDGFGDAVTIDNDGTVALVTAASDANGLGAVYVYTLKKGVWSRVAELTGTASNKFGTGIALSQSGATALVGAPAAAGGIGAVYLFQEPSGGWSGSIASTSAVASFTDPDTSGQQTFGNSVALSNDGNTALVGTVGPADDVFVYTAAKTGGWGATTTYAAKLTDGTTNTSFGSPVALSGDGTTALVGMSVFGAGPSNPGSGSTGHVYLYTQSSGWTSTSTPTAVLTDPTTNGGSIQFGVSVALSNDNTTALIGSPGDYLSGAAFLYRKAQNSGWTSTNVPTATLTDANTTSGEYVGSSVALDGTGATALVGAPGYNNRAGAAFLFKSTSSGWSSTSASTPTWTNPDGASQDSFSQSLALNGSGANALVAAPLYSNGRGVAWSFAPSSLSATLNAPSSVGGSTNYQADYIVTNTGSTASGDVLVELALPTNATYVSSSESQGGGCAYVASAPTVICDLGSIPVGNTPATAYFTLRSSASAGTIQNEAFVVNGDPNLSQTVDTSVVAGSGSSSGGTSGSTSGSGGGGAFGLWALLALLAMAGAMRLTRRAPSSHGPVRVGPDLK